MGKCIVTGGAGFIGSNLVDKLIDRDWEVVIIDDLSTGRADYINPQARFHKADIASCSEMEEIFAGEANDGPIDRVFHLAAQIDVRASVADPFFDKKINLEGGANILDNCYRNKIEKVLFASSGGAVYGDTQDIPSTENTMPAPISPYGIHKLAFENYLYYYSRVLGQKYFVLRPSNVYGPRQYKGGEAGVVTIFIDNAVNGKQSVLYGDGSQTRDFVYVDDVVDAFLKGAESDSLGTFNVSTGVETPISAVVEAIESATGEKMDLRYDKPQPGDQSRSCLDSSLIKQVLSWKPQTDLTQGIKKTIEWSRSQKDKDEQ